MISRRAARWLSGESIAAIAQSDGVTFHTVYDALRRQEVLPNSYLADEFDAALQRVNLPTPEREYAFVQAAPAELQQHFMTPKTRKLRGWRFDYAFPWHKLAVEVDGGRFVTGGGAHGADREKRNSAAIIGWRVLYFDTRMLEDPDACVQIVALALTCLPSA